MEIDKDFMLPNEVSKSLYSRISDYPIVDYHCHLNPKDIFEDKVFKNIVDLWLKEDHYKWRAMRANGVEECKITGNASNEEKFKVWAETLEHLIGNPLYQWSQLEMCNIFDWRNSLNSRNWEQVYLYMNQFINEQDLSPRKLIKQSSVIFIGTTDSPLDSLEYHKKIREDPTISTVVAPTFRPDCFFSIDNEFKENVEKLAELTNKKISSYRNLLLSLSERLTFFILNGCKASDHSFEEFVYMPVNEKKLEFIMEKALFNKKITRREKLQWQSGLFTDLCKIYRAKNLVVQVHFGARRNNNTKMLERLGLDSGFDSMSEQVDFAKSLNTFLDKLSYTNELPKMIFYNLNPIYNTILANTLANFQDNQENISGKLQYGAAWWFNDTKEGMIEQMQTYANQGLLSHFIGMLTDSRSFLSYQRHDYFRRILSQLMGQWIENKEILDLDSVYKMMDGIAYKNAKKYFGV